MSFTHENHIIYIQTHKLHKITIVKNYWKIFFFYYIILLNRRINFPLVLPRFLFGFILYAKDGLEKSYEILKLHKTRENRKSNNPRCSNISLYNNECNYYLSYIEIAILDSILVLRCLLQLDH